jgi:hypothetical protein
MATSVSAAGPRRIGSGHVWPFLQTEAKPGALLDRLELCELTRRREVR